MARGDTVATLQFVGHLTAADVRRQAFAVDRTASTLLVDCLAMTDYDPDARAEFVAWNKRTKAQFDRVAIVTDKLAWRMVIAAMSLASGQTMRAFDDVGSARAWLRTG
jgi:hypothetical protein